MELASPRGLPPRRRRRWLPTWKLPVVLSLYLVALSFGWSIVRDSGTLAQIGDEPEAVTAQPRPGLAPNETDVALGTLTARAARSVVTVGKSAGFVAWTANGLSLVLTSRPVGGWQTGPDRGIVVTAGGARHEGKLVRTDPRTGLGLVRVQGDLGRPLWQERARVQVEPGDRLAVVSPREPRVFSATEVFRQAIWGAGAGTVPGHPVIDADGRLVGVTTGGRVVPIDRACGAIRRC